MTELSAWIAGVLVVIGTFLCAVLVINTRHGDEPGAGLLPSGLGDAVDARSHRILGSTIRSDRSVRPVRHRISPAGQNPLFAGIAYATDCLADGGKK
jgi:hypothetical protein